MPLLSLLCFASLAASALVTAPAATSVPTERMLDSWMLSDSRDSDDAKKLRDALTSAVSSRVVKAQSTVGYKEAIDNYHDMMNPVLHQVDDWAPANPEDCDDSVKDEKSERCIRRSVRLLADHDKKTAAFANKLLNDRSRWGGKDVKEALTDQTIQADQLLYQLKDLMQTLSLSKKSIVTVQNQNLMRTLAILRNVTQELTARREEFMNLVSRTRGSVTEAITKSNEALNPTVDAARKNLRAFSAATREWTVAQSADMNKDAIATVQNLKTILKPGYTRVTAKVDEIAKVFEEFKTTVDTQVKQVTDELPKKVEAVKKMMEKEADEASDLLNARIPSVAEREKKVYERAIAGYLSAITGNLQSMQTANVVNIKKMRVERDKQVAMISSQLATNLSQVEKTAMAATRSIRGELVDPVVTVFNQTNRGLTAANEKFKLDADLSIVDAQKLLNQTVTAFTTVIKQYEDDWSQAKLAASGDFGALTNEFMNRLGSVGAALEEEVASVKQDIEDVRVEGAEDLEGKKFMLTANMNDVNNYMGGAATHVDEETENLKELLLTKQQEVKATVAFLQEFLQSRVQGAGRTYEEAIGELAGVIKQVGSVTDGNSQPVDEAKSELERQKSLMNQQVNALTMAADVKTEALAELMAAAEKGDKAQFDQLFSQIVGQNEALADAVDKNLEIASITTALANEADGARKQFLQARLHNMVGDSGSQMELLRAQVTGQLAAARGSLNSMANKNLATFQKVTDEALSSAVSLADIPASTDAVKQQIARIMTPLIVRMDNFRSSVIPKLVDSLNNYAATTRFIGNNTVGEFKKYVDQSVTSSKAQAESLATEGNKAVAGRMAGRLGQWDSNWEVIKNDTESIFSHIPGAEAEMMKAVDELKKVAADTAKELDNLRRAQIVESLRGFVSTSLGEENARVAAMNPNNTMAPVRSRVEELYALTNRSIAGIEQYFMSVKEPIVTQIKKDSDIAREVNDNFTRAMRDFDLGDVALVKELVTREIAEITRAWQVLESIAPTVGVQLNSMLGSNLRARVGSVLADLSKVEAASSEAYTKALLTTSSVNVTAAVGDLFNAIEENFKSSSTLQGKIYDAYGSADLFTLASVLETVGGGVGAVGQSSGAMTSAALAKAGEISAEATAEKTTALHIKELSGDAVTALLSVFLAKKVEVDESLSDEQKAVLGQKADLETVIALWSSMFGSAINTTQTGYENLAALDKAVFATLEAKSAANKAYVDERLGKADTEFEAEKARMESVKVQQAPVVEAIAKRQAEIRQTMNTMTGALTQKRAGFLAEIVDKETEDSRFSAEIGMAVDNWASDLRSAVASKLNTLTVV